MTSDHNVDNPFDVGRDILKSIQIQVHDLQIALRQEQQERKQNVENIQAALAREISQRSSHLQQMDHSLQHEAQRLDQAQHRLRLDVGDLRAAVNKASEDQQTDARNMRQQLTAEVVRLTSALQKLRTDHETEVAVLTRSLENEVQNRERELHVLENKVDKEDEHLRSMIKANLRDFEEYRDAMEADYTLTKQTTSHLCQDVAWLAVQLKGAGLTAELFRGCEWTSVDQPGDLPPGQTIKLPPSP